MSGYFTGGRLVDLARLTWGDIDLSEKTITFAQRKTGSSVQVPIHQDLYEYLLEHKKVAEVAPPGLDAIELDFSAFNL